MSSTQPPHAVDHKEEIKEGVELIEIHADRDTESKVAEAPPFSKSVTGTKSRRLSGLKGIPSSQVLLSLDEQNKMLENMNLGCCPSGHNLTKTKKTEAQSHYYHLIEYVCDYCWNIIEDVRYQCRLCDFDFCSNCYLKIRLGNKAINYLKIAKWTNDIGPMKKKQYWKKITVKVKKSDPEQWEKLLAQAAEEKQKQKRQQKEDKHRQMQKLLSPIPALATLAEAAELDYDIENKPVSDGQQSPISPQPPLNTNLSHDQHSITSSSRIGHAIYSKIPFIPSLDNEQEIQKFLAHFIVLFLQNISNKAHQASVDVDSVMSFVKDDAVFMFESLRDKKNGLNYRFFVSKHFTKLLTKLHYHKATLDEYILSPYGYKMKVRSTNPPSVSRHTLACGLCQRKLDLTAFFGPNEFAFDYRTKTCLCPAHSSCGGAAAQSPQFVSEVNVFLDIIRVYQRFKIQDPSDLADLWDEATEIQEKEKNITKFPQFVKLCVALGDKAKEINAKEEEKEEKEQTETTEDALVSLKKHAEQCGNWIFTNKTRKKDLNKQKFLESNVFVDILLDYYWEFSEYENVGGRLQDEEYDLWKYVNFWLGQRVKMTPKELYHRVVDDGDTSYLKKLVAFLYGQQECEANLISDKNVILEHLQMYLESGVDYFKNELSSTNVQKLAGIQPSSMVLANMKYLDERMDNLFLKKDDVDYDAKTDPLSFDGMNESLDVNWLALAGFIRNVGSEYMQLLIKEKFATAISLYNIDLRNKQRSYFSPKHKLRIILFHFINIFFQLNYANAPRLITPSLLVKNNTVELLLNYIVGEDGWACDKERCNAWKKQNRFVHGDKLYLDQQAAQPKDEDIGIYKELFHQNTIELSVWSLIYETKLSDILLNYHYARKRLEIMQNKNEIESSVCGHVVDLLIDTTRLSHFPVHSSRAHRRNRSLQKTVQENESGAQNRVKFIRMDENDALGKDDIKLSFHYRLIRRSSRVRGWNKKCIGPNGEFIVRFRVSAFTSSIYIRLATSPHSFQYELEVRPTISTYSQHISYCAITMEEHRKKEENERLWLPYNNHHGVWFTLHCSKTRFFLLADYLDDLEASRLRIEDVEHCPRLICKKRIKANNLINWVGFASLNDQLTISTPDTDSFILESWTKWLKATGLHKYSEAYSDIVSDYNEDEEDVDEYKSSEANIKPSMLKLDQLSKLQLKKMLKHTHSTFLIDMIDNSAFALMKKLQNQDLNVNSMLNVKQEQKDPMQDEEDIFELLSRIFKLFNPTFRLVPSLSPGCEFAVEMKCNKPLLTSVIRETFETDPEITQILGDEFIILHQIVYDKLQIDSDVWLFLSQHVADICDLDEMDTFTAKTAAATNNMKPSQNKYQLLKTFLLYAFRPTQSREQMDTFVTNLTQQTQSWTHKRSQTGRGYTRYGDNPAIEMREINNGEARVVRIYDYNTTNMLTFSFSTITKINVQLFTKLMEIRDSLPFNVHTKNKNYIEHEISNYNAIIKRLTRHPIWPYIEVKRSRAGTLERLTANKVEYVWRGGTTALLSDSALPIQMTMMNDADKQCSDGSASYERLLYYEVELEKVGVDKSINVGATLGKHFSYFTSSSQPGLRPCSWGLSGDLGLLYDENKNKTNYGPSFQNGLIVGCGFVLTTPEQFDPDDLDTDKYTSNLFFTYNGMALKFYPDQDANESLLPRSVLHKLFAVTSTGSESCKLKFNFGPRFKYDKANEMIANYFTVARAQYEKQMKDGIKKELEALGDEKEEEEHDGDVEQDEKEEEKQKPKVRIKITSAEDAGGDPDDLKQDLLTEVEEEILTELVLQFETEEKSGRKTVIEIEEEEEEGASAKHISEDAHVKLKYEALYNKVIMSYYFYLTPFNKLDSTTMYELLVQFHLLNLATIVSDVNVNGYELINLEEKVKEWVLSDDPNEEKYRVALLLLNTRTKHRELLKDFRNVMLTLSDSLYRENIVPQDVKRMNAMSLTNIPPAIRQLAFNKDDTYSQMYLLKLWRLIVHQRRLNSSGSGKGDMSSLKQEFLLDFIAYFLNNGNTIELITQLLISWSSGNFNVDRDNSNFSGKYELSILLSGFIRGSNNPISAAIQVGQFLEENRRSFPEIEAEIIEINNYVQRMAVDILEDIHSNRLAIIALEANSSLDIALDYGLQEFISSDRVQYLKQLMWTRSGDALLTAANSEHFRNRSAEIGTWYHVIFDEYTSVFRKFFTQMFQPNTRKTLYDFFFTKRNQMSWFFSPVGKMQIEFFVYIVYLILLIYVANASASVAEGVYSSTLTAAETAFWICNASFVFAEIRALAIAKVSYWSDHTNYINIFINILYVLLGLTRFLGWTETFTQCGDIKQRQLKCLDKPLNILYIVLWFVLILSVCARVSYMLFVFYNMGLLVRALFKMLRDVANFVLLIVIILFGFSLSMHLATNGEAEAFSSVWTSMRALFYAMLGEIDYEQLIEDTECQEGIGEGETWEDAGCRNNFGPLRSVVNSLLLFFWMLIAAILLINFIIAVMNNTYELVQNEVGQFVKFYRMRICRKNDRKLPSIPAPFQIIIVVFKYIWHYIIEPLVFLISGRFVNEERLICSFKHMKYFYKEEFYRRKVMEAPWFRKPFFIEFNDHVHGTPPKPPTNICQRFCFMKQATDEALCGMLYVNKDHATEQNDPSIWICGYCRCTNYEFERQKRRATSYSDIIRYYKYNDLLPPEFGFNDVDIQFLEHIAPPLCDNCFRLRFWVQRHVVIESLIAFYLYFGLSFLCIKLPLLLIILCMTVVVAVLGIVISLLCGLLLLLYRCLRRCTAACCRNLCCCCYGGPDIEYKFKEQMERHRPLNKQRIITSHHMIRRLDKSLYADVKHDGLDYFDGDVRELPVIQDAEDHLAKKRMRISKYDGDQISGDTFDDSDDDTSSYKTLSSDNKYDLVLVVLNTDFSVEERENFIQLLHGADGLLNAENQNQSDLARRYHHRFRSIFYPKNAEDIVRREIMTEGNQRIVLANDQYRKCIKFKKNVSKLMEEIAIEKSKNNDKYVLPLFEVKVMPTRHSLSYNFGQKQTLKANYEQRQSILATQQTRTRYQFQYNPVLKRINQYK